MNSAALQLLRKLITGARVAESAVDGMLSGDNLSATKLLTLRHIIESTDPVSLGRLAHCMSFAKSNATQLVDNLEAAGLVRRVSDPDDRRCTRLELTKTGQEKLDRGAEALEPLAEKMTAIYSKEEIETLTRLLSRLQDLVE